MEDSQLLLVGNSVGMIVVEDILDDCRSSVMQSLVVPPVHHVVSHETPFIET